MVAEEWAWLMRLQSSPGIVGRKGLLYYTLSHGKLLVVPRRLSIHYRYVGGSASLHRSLAPGDAKGELLFLRHSSRFSGGFGFGEEWGWLLKRKLDSGVACKIYRTRRNASNEI